MRASRRLESLPPYHFAEYARVIAEKRAAGIDVISLSMGDPDLPTPEVVLEALERAAHEPVNQRYPEYEGMPLLREATAAWFARRFGVELDPRREILPLIGSKEGLAHLPLAVLDEGDVALMPDPQYPVYPTAVALAGGENYLLPLLPERDWLPDLAAIPPEVLRRAKTLWLNYPNNPVGACAPRAFFEEAVAFARRHDILLVHDAAYVEVRYDGYRPASILEIEGAKEVAVEFHSLSKSHNMAGFRVGMLIGNAEIVQALNRLKSNLDTGIFRPVQVAAARSHAGGPARAGAGGRDAEGQPLSLAPHPGGLDLVALRHGAARTDGRRRDAGHQLRRARRGLPARVADRTGRTPRRGDRADGDLRPVAKSGRGRGANGCYERRGDQLSALEARAPMW